MAVMPSWGLGSVLVVGVGAVPCQSAFGGPSPAGDHTILHQRYSNDLNLEESGRRHFISQSGRQSDSSLFAIRYPQHHTNMNFRRARLTGTTIPQ
jgi:hypothetical protein